VDEDETATDSTHEKCHIAVAICTNQPARPLLDFPGELSGSGKRSAVAGAEDHIDCNLFHDCGGLDKLARLVWQDAPQLRKLAILSLASGTG
jgi:hypothetical protein